MNIGHTAQFVLDFIADVLVKEEYFTIVLVSTNVQHLSGIGLFL